MTDQSSLNKKMADMGKERLRATLKANKDRASNNKSSRTIFDKAVVELLPVIEEFMESGPIGKNKKYRHLISDIPYEVISVIVIKTILDRISQNRKTISLCKKIGSSLEVEALFCKARNEHREEFDRNLFNLNSKADLTKPLAYILPRTLLSNIPELNFEPWTPEEKATIGLTLLQMVLEFTGLVTTSNIKVLANGKVITLSYVIGTPETLDFIDKANERLEEISPVYLPMVESPNPYTAPSLGGYDSEVYSRWGMIKTKPSVSKRMTEEQMPLVYKAINAQQEVKLRINRNTFEVFSELWLQGNEIAGLPPREDLPPLVFEGNYPNEEYKNFKIEERNRAIENVANKGRRVQTARTHNLAQMFLDQDFYIPYKMDFRGRLNTIPSFLTPQGNDISKGLLEFSEGEELTSDGLDWFCVAGANAAGKDKLPYQERVDWVKENAEFIYNIYLDPLDNLDWTKADSPFVFLSWCLEYGSIQDKVYGKGKFVEWEDLQKVGGFVSHFMCAIDATNSGLQIYSAILRDPIGAKATNLFDSGVVADVYQEIADNVFEKIKTIAQTSTKERDKYFAEGWLSFFGDRMPRSAVKKVVMTIPYSLSKHSSREYIEEWYNNELNERGMRRNRPFPETFYGTKFLSDLVYDETMNTVRGARDAMEWLKEVSNILTENSCPIEYVTPTGFIVHQAQCMDDRLAISTSIKNKYKVTKSKKLTMKQQGGRLSKLKQKNSICPNVVHSIDASILVLALNYLVDAGVKNFTTVHDSFSTTASSVSILAGSLRQAMVDIFSSDVLYDLKTQLETKYRVELPPPPPMGTFDIKEVLTSPYTFC
jgi:DNA-directed RNA polymerase